MMYLLFRIFWQKAVEGSLNAERFGFHADGRASQVYISVER
jgi:hypothetical protein